MPVAFWNPSPATVAISPHQHPVLSRHGISFKPLHCDHFSSLRSHDSMGCWRGEMATVRVGCHEASGMMLMMRRISGYMWNLIRNKLVESALYWMNHNWNLFLKIMYRYFVIWRHHIKKSFGQNIFNCSWTNNNRKQLNQSFSILERDFTAF